MKYRIYETKVDRDGNRKVTRGQYEVAHIDPSTNQAVFYCPEPGILDRLIEQIREKNSREESSQLYNEKGEWQGTGKKRTTVHLIRGTGTEEVLHVMCGAKGSLYTTLDRELVSCSNCRDRMTQSTSQKANQQQSQKQTPNKGKEEGKPVMSTTSTAIKDKIAAAKAKKAAGGTVAAGVPLVGGDEGAPDPKPTVAKGVKKQQVAAAKAPKGPKVLNLCGCGCGASVKSRFLPGHDAKLHGWVKKVAAGTMDLNTLPALVKDGMYPKVKQGRTVNPDKTVTLVGVAPVVEEAVYLESLKGKGEVAED